MSSCHSDLLAPPAPTHPDPAYPLARDAAEHERLEAQARFWSADAGALFDAAGIAAGWRVADLGCGTLHVAQLLAARVGQRGSVLALDNDAALVRRLTPRAVALGAAPVRMQMGDAYATGWPSASLDAAHARFLAAPAGRLDPLLAEMQRLVRPGGLLLLQEPDADSWELPAAGAAWTRLRALIRTGFRTRGGDFDAGRALVPALRRAGLVDVQTRSVVRSLPAEHPYSALPIAFARQLRPLWLASGIDVGEVDALVDRLRASLQPGRTTQTFTLVQAWGRAPS